MSVRAQRHPELAEGHPEPVEGVPLPGEAGRGVEGRGSSPSSRSPEPVEGRGRIHVALGACDYCGACVSICPPDAISISERTLEVDPATCTLCKLCIWVCPPGALSLVAD